MLPEEIRAEIGREPFVPLRIYLTDGRKLKVPFEGVARMVQGGVLVMKGVKKGSRRAKGFEVVAYDKIERIKQRKKSKHVDDDGDER